MSSAQIRRDNEEFQRAVKKLSSGIGKASVLWEDQKFLELSDAVSVIAGISKDVIVSGDSFSSAIDSFEKIASEKY